MTNRKPGLTGFVRQVIYKKNLMATSIIEGQMKEGEFRGFARVMEFHGGNIEIKTGYFNTVRGVLIPYGKFTWQHMSDEGELRTKCVPGLYVGVQDGHRIKMVHC